MLITNDFSAQTEQNKIYLRPNLAIYGQVFVGESSDIKASLGGVMSSIAALFNAKLGSYNLVWPSDLRYMAMGNYCYISEGVKVFDKRDYSFINSAMCHIDTHNDYHCFESFSQPQPQIASATTVIGHDVRMGSKSRVQNGLIVGHGAIIEDSAIVRKHVPPFAIVSGNPAKVIGFRFEPEVRERIIQSGWYRYDWQGVALDWGNIEKCLDLMEEKIAAGQSSLLGDGYTFESKEGESIVANKQSWTLEQELQNLFGTDKMQEIFALDEVKAQTMSS